jgi:hypothetical protein
LIKIDFQSKVYDKGGHDMLDVTGKVVKQRTVEMGKYSAWDHRTRTFYDVEYPVKITYEFEDGTKEVITPSKVEDAREQWDHEVLEIDPE